MENQVLLNFDIELGPTTTTTIEVTTTTDDVITDTDDHHPTTTYRHVSADLEPYEGMEFDSEEAAKSYYNSYARRVGFSTRVSSSRRSRKDGAIIQRSFVCAKQGFRNPNEKRTLNREIKRPRIVTRVGCRALLSVKINKFGKWVVVGFVKDHNHDLVPPDQVHCLRSHRQIAGPAKVLIDTLQAAGLGPRRIMSALVKEYGGVSNVGFTEVDCRNYMRNNRQGGVFADFRLFIDCLKEFRSECSEFYYDVQCGEFDDECFVDNNVGSIENVGNVGNVFWVDSRARMDYCYFGDTVIVDTTYRSNRYRLPFVPFTGVNHHGQPVLFGCAFLINESESSFVWLFNTWLVAMSGRPPVSITTDYDVTIASAVAQVFPDARHRFCKWHIFKKCQEKLSHVLLEHPGFEVEFHKCVNMSESVDEFESCWLSLLDRYDLRDNDWLQSIYSARKQWIPVYLRDAFFAEMSIAQCSDIMNSYFDGYINASTNLNQFLKLYEKAIESRIEKEVKADYETMSTPPVLKTPSPMEKQASELYTRKIFTRFQDELVGTLTFTATEAEDDGEVITYQVAKYGEDHKAFYVRFNVLEMKATCSCQMFEFSGLLCRHVLAVFRVTNVLTLPPLYILKRWTRNAKSNVVLEEQRVTATTSYLESHTVRYNTLRHEAFKLVDKGASTSETYDVAMAALQEAEKKVAHALQNEGRSSAVNVRARDSLRDGMPRNKASLDAGVSISEQLSEDYMDQKIRELSEELEHANRKCEVYRTNLLSVLKDMEHHKQHLAMKIHGVKLSLNDSI